MRTITDIMHHNPKKNLLFESWLSNALTPISRHGGAWLLRSSVVTIGSLRTSSETFDIFLGSFKPQVAMDWAFWYLQTIPNHSIRLTFAENAGKSPTPCSRALSLECIDQAHMAQAPGDFTLSGHHLAATRKLECLVDTSNIHQHPPFKTLIPRGKNKTRTCSHWNTALGSKPDSGRVKAQLFGRDWIEPGHTIIWLTAMHKLPSNSWNRAFPPSCQVRQFRAAMALQLSCCRRGKHSTSYKRIWVAHVVFMC